MGYFTEEDLSEDLSRPFEMLKLTYLASTFLLTTSEDVITYNSETYTPTPFSRTAINNTDDLAKSNLTIILPKDHPLGDIFKKKLVTEIVSVTIFEAQSTTVSPPVANTIWKGRLVNIEWVEEGLQLTVESVFTSLQRTGLRRRCGARCPHVVYSPQCGADKAAATYLATNIRGQALPVVGRGSPVIPGLEAHDYVLAHPNSAFFLEPPSGVRQWLTMGSGSIYVTATEESFPNSILTDTYMSDNNAKLFGYYTNPSNPILTANYSGSLSVPSGAYKVYVIDDVLINDTDEKFRLTLEYNTYAYNGLLALRLFLDDRDSALLLAYLEPYFTGLSPDNRAQHLFNDGYFYYTDNLGIYREINIKQSAFGIFGDFVTSDLNDQLVIYFDRREYHLNINYGDKVNLVFGCVHNQSDCKVKHDNEINFGGQPYFKKLNPFGGSSIY